MDRDDMPCSLFVDALAIFLHLERAPPRAIVLSMKRDFYDGIWRRKAGRVRGEVSGGREAVALELIRERPGALLDLGCGDGAFLLAAAPGRIISVGLDLSAEAVALATRAGLTAEAHDFSSEPLPFSDGTFELVTCLDVIEHVFDIRFMLGEAARVLVPGGLMIIATPNIQWLPRLWAIACGRWPRTSGDPEGFDGGHIHYFTFASMEYELRRAGLTPSERRFCRGAERPLFEESLAQALLPRRTYLEYYSPSIIVAATR
jgi:SAM-dependent methyltransferase